MKHEAKGVHRIMWHFSPEDTLSWTKSGTDRIPRTARNLVPSRRDAAGFPWPEAPDEPQLVSPGAIDPEMISYYAEKLG